jgi:hydroxymethylpyrimidine/phosphomethylpyrimidine kinase
MTLPIALTIAGSDSSGGAGIQADLKTFAALGVYGASVITALTAQNTTGVSGIHPVPADFVTAQIDAVFGDLDVAAVKIGMMAQPTTVEAIVAGLARWSPKHVVLDPVMVATSGARLLAADAVAALRTRLIPRAFLITPNLPEAAALLDQPVAASEAAIERQGQRLLAMGCHAVLIKGGHGQGPESIDYLISASGTLAHRDPPYSWHRMLIVFRHRGRPCQGLEPGHRGSQRQGLDQRRDRRSRPPRCRPWSWTDPSFSWILLRPADPLSGP